jgi:hypothetical protein
VFKFPRLAGALLLIAAAVATMSGLAPSLGIITLAVAGMLGFLGSSSSGAAPSTADSFWDEPALGEEVGEHTEQARPADGVGSEQQGSGAVHR